MKGGLLSHAAAEESKKFTVSVVVGDDVVPRLSVANIAKLSERLKNSLIICLIMDVDS